MAENRTKHNLILPTNMNSAFCVQFPFSTRDEFPFLISRYKGRGFGFSEKIIYFLICMKNMVRNMEKINCRKKTPQIYQMVAPQTLRSYPDLRKK